MILVGNESPRQTDYGSRSGDMFFSDGTGLHRLRSWLPYGITAIDNPTSIASYEGRSYMVGGYSANIVIDENFMCWRQGLLPPPEEPVVTGGSGSAANLYFSWYDEVTGERSSLSGAASGYASGTRTWASLPQRPPDDIFIPEGTVTWNEDGGVTPCFSTDDPRTRTFYLRAGDTVVIDGGYYKIKDIINERCFTTDRTPTYGTDTAGLSFAALPYTRATHLECWVEESGDYPRLAARVPIGGTQLVESTTLATRGEAFLSTFERFPWCRVNTIYHDRQLMAGNPDAPDTVYVSDLFYPERWGGLSFKTRNGEKIVSLISTRDYCLVMTDRSSYLFQGYTDQDFTLTVADQNVGAVTHVGNTVVHGNPVVWTQEGPFMFNGSWQPMSPENKHYFASALFSDGAGTSGIELFQDMGSSASSYMPSETRMEFWRGSVEPAWNTWNIGGTIVVDYTTMLPQAGGAFQSCRVALDSGFFSKNANLSPWYQVVPHNQHVNAFLKVNANEPYGHMYGIYEAVWPYVDQATLTHPDTGAIIGSATDPVGAQFGRYLCRQEKAPVENADWYWIITNEPGVGNVPWIPQHGIIPFDFHVVTGHHLDDAGAYPREGKSYKRLWIHSIAEGAVTRFFYWHGVWSEVPPEYTYTLDRGDVGAVTYAIVEIFPGEEFALKIAGGRTGAPGSGNTVGTVDITKSLFSPMAVDEQWLGQVVVENDRMDPYDPSFPWNDNSNCWSYFRGIHALNPGQQLVGRGLTIRYSIYGLACQVRYLGWGGEFGPGPIAIYGLSDPVPLVEAMAPPEE